MVGESFCYLLLWRVVFLLHRLVHCILMVNILVLDLVDVGIYVVLGLCSLVLLLWCVYIDNSNPFTTQGSFSRSNPMLWHIFFCRVSIKYFTCFFPTYVTPKLSTAGVKLNGVVLCFQREGVWLNGWDLNIVRWDLNQFFVIHPACLSPGIHFLISM